MGRWKSVVTASCVILFMVIFHTSSFAVSIEEKLDALIRRIDALEERVERQERVIHEQEKTIAEQAKALEHAKKIADVAKEEAPGTLEKALGNIGIFAGITGIVQGTQNNDDNAKRWGTEEGETTDGSFSVDLAIASTIGESGTALILLEGGNGERIDEEVPTFSGINDDADCEDRIHLTEAWYEG
jgi:hypothetical protein